ncbi:hypothetical protein B0H17DRAFT_1204453 [Mycena rosella]|uniref:Uncharacterized protein n=1 Tax=Mycena rosella TaxID=1033263 RepID=A0AAD7GB51_MYCRO|nr:hypothetical protein B0H17DRAFT_1204453 [Mycena rosella]
MHFDNLLNSKSTLLRTSLAYIDFDQRLKVLAPIREYVRSLHPPPTAPVTPLPEYFFDLVRLFDSYQELPSGDLVQRIASDFGNISSLLPRLVTHLTLAHRTQEWKEVCASLQRIRDVFVGEGDDATACSLFVLVLENSTAMDIHQARADCMRRIGDIRKRGGD